MYNCARVGRPTGGEKDILAPISIKASPDFNSLNFKGDKIVIYFDEFIKFKDLNQQLIVSPPLKYPPEITPLGYPSKKITIVLKDTLKDQMTYTFNFGNAIVDNSEANPLKRFKYLFSTGDYIDSLSVSGTIKDALLQGETKNISVLLYKADSTYYDSIIYKEKPIYVSNTLDSIGFYISNIKNEKYHIFAINDRNKNLLFDPLDEKIAFIDAPIQVERDTSYSLELFKEIPKFEIKNISEESKNHLIISYVGDYQSFIDKIVNKSNDSIDFLYLKDKKTDSVHVWHRNVKSDTLYISIKQTDSLETRVQRLRSKELDSIKINKSIKSILAPNDSLFILSNTPIVSVDSKMIELIDKDSIAIPFSVFKEGIADRFLIDFNREQDNSYTLSILQNSITDYLGQKNDSLSFSFKTKELKDYGEIKVDIKGVKTPVIVELLTSSGKFIAKEHITIDKEVVFKYLSPKKYQLRAIIDVNNNKKWDTGNLLNNIQPEKVLYYSTELEVRANWTISEVFTMK